VTSDVAEQAYVQIVHLTASFLFGGPERQILGLSGALPSHFKSTILSFREDNRCRAFLEQVRNQGFEGIALEHDTPHLLAAGRELVQVLRNLQADVLCCHGYKANLLGLLAARHEAIPVVSVSRGWTAESRRVRLYEALDRRVLRRMDRVVCVSRAQAEKVRRAGVKNERLLTIRNAVRTESFARPDSEYPDNEYIERLRGLFPEPPELIVGAAGRLSPEKGFEVLIDAAVETTRAEQSVGFVLFGDGQLHDSLTRRIRERGLDGRFILAGFHDDLDRYLPHFDLLAVPSYTEGLPNVVLEAFAAGVPVVATAVGGTPELVEDGVNGRLVSSGDSQAMAKEITRLLQERDTRRTMGDKGRQRVEQEFTFNAQMQRYRQLFGELMKPELMDTGRSGKSALRRTRRTAVNWAMRSGLFRLRRTMTGRRHVILTFHRVRAVGERLDPFDTCPSLPADVFRQILEHVRDRFDVVTLSDLFKRAAGATPMAAITFDDGWRDSYDVAFPLLRELELPATIFVTTGKIGSSQPFWQQALGKLFRGRADRTGESDDQDLRGVLLVERDVPLTADLYRRTVRHWKTLEAVDREGLLLRAGWKPPANSEHPRCFLSEAEIREMTNAGIRFGSHTVSHPILPRESRAAMLSELTQSKSTLEGIVGEVVDTLAYPNGDWSGEVVRSARSVGYRIGCTTCNKRVSGRDDPLRLPRIEPEWDFAGDCSVFDACMFRWQAR